MTKYHTFWPRFWAGFVDGLVFLPISFLDGYLSAPARGPFVLIVWGVIFYSVYWLYSVLLHARYGQTLGKMATKVRVLDLSEERIPTFRQAFIRDIGYILLNTLSLFWFLYIVATGRYTSQVDVISGPGGLLVFASLAWFLLEVVTMLTNTKRRAFHDFIAGTVVVRKLPPPPRKTQKIVDPENY